MPVRSDPHPVVERFARVRAAAAARYGPDSQAVTFLLYEELISMRTLLAGDPGCAPARDRIDELVPDIQSRYDTAGAVEPAQVYHRTVSVDPTVIEFDRGFFELRYRRALRDLGRRAVRIRDRDQALALLTAGACYLYAVDDEGDLWVWPQPHRLADVMFGWAPGRPAEGPRVVHPMLVPDRLRVRAAGELVVVGSPERVFVTANLKSGHFRPPRACAAEIRRAATSALELTSPVDVDVFTMPQPTVTPTC
ncbi:hypothetical protein ACGF0D_23490 [Kitasatospora sp. NPDC048298]|uniref:hypothetical protein n=1 Tax=Kitasatospora sp. NPDC048298 TaxID=3364049 RepID=UPI0037159948